VERAVPTLHATADWTWTTLTVFQSSVIIKRGRLGARSFAALANSGSRQRRWPWWFDVDPTELAVVTAGCPHLREPFALTASPVGVLSCGGIYSGWPVPGSLRFDPEKRMVDTEP